MTPHIERQVEVYVPKSRWKAVKLRTSSLYRPCQTTQKPFWRCLRSCCSGSFLKDPSTIVQRHILSWRRRVDDYRFGIAA